MGSKRKRSAQDAPAAQPPAKKQQKPAPQKPAKKAAPKALTPLDSSPFADNPNSSELKRETEVYETLKSEDRDERIDAASAIVSALFENGGVEEATLQRHLERRLFRGLASGRKAARLGNSMVLAEILEQLFGAKDLANTRYPGLTFEVLMGILVAKTKPDGDLSGQEEKDHFLGLLFGLSSFVQAKVLFEHDERWYSLLGRLIDLVKKKPWIREEVGSVIVKALAQMNQTQAEKTLEQLYEAGMAVTPEGVGIWLTAKARFPDLKSPTKPWGSTGSPLDRLQSLAKALKESSGSEDGGKQHGNWNHQLHFAWDIVLDQFAASIKAKKRGVESDFENFWKVAVDENLFSATASNERKYWGFSLFQRVIEGPYSKVFPSIFSRNLTRSLVNHLQAHDRYLHAAAEKSLKAVIRTVETDPTLLPLILTGLLGATYNFDRATKTKTTEKLLANVTDENAKEVIDVLLQGALNSDAKEADTRWTLLGDILLSIIRKAGVGSQAPSWVKDNALPLLANVAYSKTINTSQKARVLFRNRLMSVFGCLLADLKDFVYPCHLLQKTIPDAVEMDDELSKTREEAESIMGKILKREKKAAPADKVGLQALALLYALAIFQLYNGESEAVEVLDELKLCYDKLVRGKDTDNSDMEASEVLVQLLMSFLSKPSALLRKVSKYVFQAFMGDMTSGCLRMMTDVLESGESLRGQQELFDQEPEDEDAMDEDESGDELDSDVEEVKISSLPAGMGRLQAHLAGKSDEEDSEDGDGDEEASADDEGDDEDAIEEDNEENKKLEEALAKALGTNRADEDGDSDSDADMTDSEMMAMDAKLVEIFSQRKKIPNKKQEQKEAKETIVNFKSRILDLLELYVKKQASNPLTVDLLLPLLQLIRTTKTKHLAEKARNIIGAFATSAKKEGVTYDISVHLELMEAIHLEASKDPSHSFCKAASAASLILASGIYRADKSNYREIEMVYMGTRVACVEKELKIHASFQQDFFNFFQSCCANT